VDKKDLLITLLFLKDDSNKSVISYSSILFVSLGVPILNMGDEFGHSSGGSSIGLL
jgi:pullulanase/glycogen debranching enzyme